MRIRRLLSLALASTLATATFAETDAPLSAIDWLSDSVDDSPQRPTPESAPATAVPNDIRVVPLDAPVADRVGLIGAEALSVPVDLWGQSSARDLARELGLLQFGADTPPVIEGFVASVLQAGLEPPVDAAVDDQFFLARVDRLLELGHLDAAEALLTMAGLEDAQRFRRAFDIGLLKGTETETCRLVEETPELSPTYPTRIFCLARLGQFDVAALTLGNAKTLGILSEEEDALLLRFLDPELFDEGTLPPAPRVPTPLEYRLFEAVGERLPTDQLPVAFAVADLTPTVGWKTRLRAAERLAATGALGFQDLLAVFSEREAAASGGVWERVRAVQDLAEAQRRNDGRALAEALPLAWAAAGEAGYRAALADWIAPSLGRLSDRDGGAHLAFEIALLAEAEEEVRRFAGPSAEDQFLLALSRKASAPPPIGFPLARAVARGLAAPQTNETFETLLGEGRTGEVVFRALAGLADGAGGNPDMTAHSLAALRRAGLDDLAHQIAVELILLEGSA
ncbi:MAG: hypothetical protein QNJ20_15890 [Paracoccaceae bacterium]|nr:hypothetical protein [Paracoccaceae bacterium]